MAALATAGAVTDPPVASIQTLAGGRSFATAAGPSQSARDLTAHEEETVIPLHGRRITPFDGTKPPRVTSGAGFWYRLRSAGLVLPVLYLLAVLGGYLATSHTGDDGVTCVLTPPKPENHYCLIAQVSPGSPADAVGLQPGDIIAATDGDLFVSYDGVLRWYYHRSAGESVMLTVRLTSPGRAAPSANAVGLPMTLASRAQAPGIAINFPFWTVSGLVALLVAVVVIRARPDDPAARLLFLFSLAFALRTTVAVFMYAGRRDPPLGSS